jgi:hypothetical protein
MVRASLNVERTMRQRNWANVAHYNTATVADRIVHALL